MEDLSALRFLPITDRHAIQTVAFVVELSSPVSPRQVEEIIKLHDSIKDQLPVIQRQKSFNVSVGFGGNPVQQVGQEQLSGVTFDRVDLNKRREYALSIINHLIIVNVDAYARWEEACGIAFPLFDKIISALNASHSVVAFTLEYIDLFVPADVTGRKKKGLTISKMFNNKASFVPQNIFNTKGYWHSYHGYFVKQAGDIAFDMLNNINVTFGYDIIRKHNLVTIACNHRSIIQQGNVNVASNNTNGSYACRDACFTAMHEENKTIIKDLLSKGLCKQIGL